MLYASRHMDAPTVSPSLPEIPSLHCLKTLCALFVVIIHSRMIGRDGLMPAIVVAVPCFYAISGYFLYTGNRQKEIGRARRWIVKILLITALTNMAYLAFFHLLDRHYAWRELAFNIFSGSVISVHLWYLSALWQALLLFLLILRCCPRLVHLLPCLLLLSLAMARYSFLFWNEPPAIWLRCNSITVALPCLSLGYLLADIKKDSCAYQASHCCPSSS